MNREFKRFDSEANNELTTLELGEDQQHNGMRRTEE